MLRCIALFGAKQWQFFTLLYYIDMLLF